MSAGTDVRPRGADGPRFWDQLLLLIEEGQVVPVVGQDLLTVEIDGQPTLLYPWLAKRLAEYLGVPADDLPAASPLHAVACRLLAEGGDLQDLYPALKTLLPATEKIGVPEPLRQLARIRPLKLFVSTTFDPLLARALDEARFGGQVRTQVFDYSLDELQDLDRPLDEMDRPAVFHLFGRISARPAFAVTQEDVLELFCALQSERRPNLLLDELSRRQILLVGNGFPDWLARFFLRIARRERLWQARGRNEVVADESMSDDPELVSFLERFSSRTRLFPGGATEFVAELSRRWEERHPPGAPAAEPPSADRTPGPLDMVKGAVFLSYASEDRPVVEALRAELESAGIDVWFDREKLEAGDDYEAKIRRNIDGCSLFVPILSRRALTAQRRFFRMEWAWAERVSLQVASNQKFILPVILDDLAADDPALPEIFRRLQAERLGAGPSHPELVKTVTQSYRAYQRSQTVPV